MAHRAAGSIGSEGPLVNRTLGLNQSASILVASMALVLLFAAAGKLRNPSAPREAFSAIGLPSGPNAVRSFAAGEAVVGLAALILGGLIPTVAISVVFGGFFGFLLAVRGRSVVLTSCGCFGREDVAIRPSHALASGLLFLAGAAAVLSGGAIPLWRMDVWSYPLPTIASAASLALLLVGVYVTWPRLLAGARPSG
jgi:hypothetical protein